MKVIVAHPDRQHSYRLAAACRQAGILDCYITTVYDRAGSSTARIKKLLKNKNRAKAESRKTSDLDDEDVIQYYEKCNLLIILLSRIPALMNFCRFLRRCLADRFGRKVAQKAIRTNADMVILYDSAALSGFRYLSEHNAGIVRILDCSTVSHEFMKNTFQKAIRLTGDHTLKKEYSYLWKDRVLDRYNREIKLGNYFLAPSRIVEESLQYSGVKENRIIRVPYGVDVGKFDFSKSDRKRKGTLKALFVGQVTCRKGIDRLLEAMNQIPPSQIELFIAGAYDPGASWYIRNRDRENVHFLGFVTGDKIAALYHTCDIFVLPSLAEGMALVGLEALAAGLPVVCSQYAGIDDLIVSGENGFVYDVFDRSALVRILRWFIDHPENIRKMSICARNTASGYTWKEYSEKVIQSILTIRKEECRCAETETGKCKNTVTDYTI